MVLLGAVFRQAQSADGGFSAAVGKKFGHINSRERSNECVRVRAAAAESSSLWDAIWSNHVEDCASPTADSIPESDVHMKHIEDRFDADRSTRNCRDRAIRNRRAGTIAEVSS